MFVPTDLMLNATRALATSALPNAPVEPDRPPRRSRIRTLLRALLHREKRQRRERDIQLDTGEIPAAIQHRPAST